LVIELCISTMASPPLS